MQVAARAFRVAVAFEAAAELLELATEHARVRERAVVHEAPVFAGRVGMRVLGRHRGFRRHARVTDEMRALSARANP